MRVRTAIVTTLLLAFAGCATTGERGSAMDGVLDAWWPAPTTNTDGSPLTDLVSYHVYLSTTKPPCPGSPFLTVAASTARPAPNETVSVRLTGLTPGRLYYVAISSVNSRGAFGGCSITASARARRRE